jgi:hypothetical protein
LDAYCWLSSLNSNARNVVPLAPNAPNAPNAIGAFDQVTWLYRTVEQFGPDLNSQLSIMLRKCQIYFNKLISRLSPPAVSSQPRAEQPSTISPSELRLSSPIEVADGHDTNFSTQKIGESSIEIRQARKEQIADLRLLLEADPTLLSADTAFTKPYEVRVLFFIVINEANGVSTFLSGRLPKFDHIQYVRGATSF